MRDEGPPGTMNRGAPYSRDSLSLTNPEKSFQSFFGYKFRVNQEREAGPSGGASVHNLAAVDRAHFRAKSR